MTPLDSLMAPISTLFDDDSVTTITAITQADYFQDKEGYAMISIDESNKAIYWIYANLSKKKLFFVEHNYMRILMKQKILSPFNVKNSILTGIIDLDLIVWTDFRMDGIKKFNFFYPSKYGSWISDDFNDKFYCLSTLEEDIKERTWLLYVNDSYKFVSFSFMKEAFKTDTPFTFSSHQPGVLTLSLVAFDDCIAALGEYDLNFFNFRNVDYPIFKKEYGSWFNDFGYYNPFNFAQQLLISYIIVNDKHLWILRIRGERGKYLIYDSRVMINHFGLKPIMVINGIMSILKEEESMMLSKLSPFSPEFHPKQNRQIVGGKYFDWLPMKYQLDIPIRKELNDDGHEIMWKVMIPGGFGEQLLNQSQMISFVGLRTLQVLNGIIQLGPNEKPLLKNLGLQHQKISVREILYGIFYEPIGSWHFNEFNHPRPRNHLSKSLLFCAHIFGKAFRDSEVDQRLWIINTGKSGDIIFLTDSDMEHLSDVHREFRLQFLVDDNFYITISNEKMLLSLLGRLPFRIYSSI